jgi:ATP-dependent RNA helicase RhlE
VLFKDLNLIPSILSAVEDQGYTTPSPIQQAAIPPILEGRDLIGCAQTGTGKTAAFALPVIQLLTKSKPAVPNAIRVLILTPTRELAAQIEENFNDYGKNLQLRNTVIFGGVGDGPQKAKLRRGVDILIATPGRLIDLLSQRALTLSHVEIFILDEADRMLDMGFVNDVRRISALLPSKRQTLLFSATMPTEIRKLADSLLRNPIKVEVTPVSSTVDKIEQGIYFVRQDSKSALLKHVLSDPSVRRALVFTRTKHGADRLRKALDANNIPSEAIHGNKSQGARQRSLANFKEGVTRVLVATDLAARGIDVDDITHVVNYDLPAEAETYVHRIGRTARAGASGISLSFCGPDDRDLLASIERLIKKRINVVATPLFDTNMIQAPRENRSEQGRPRRPDHNGGHAPRGGQNNSRSRNGGNGGHGGNNGGQNQGRRSDAPVSHLPRAQGPSHSQPSRPTQPIREGGNQQDSQSYGRGQSGSKAPGKRQGGSNHRGQGAPFQREYFSNKD